MKVTDCFLLEITKCKDGGHYIHTVNRGISLIDLVKVLEVKLESIRNEIEADKQTNSL